MKTKTATLGRRIPGTLKEAKIALNSENKFFISTVKIVRRGEEEAQKAAGHIASKLMPEIQFKENIGGVEGSKIENKLAIKMNFSSHN